MLAIFYIIRTRSPLVVFVAVFLSACAVVGVERRKNFSAGSIVLSRDYILRESCNLDVSHIDGELINRKTGFRIRYSSGRILGIDASSQVLANPKYLKSYNYKIISSKKYCINGDFLIVTLVANTRLNEKIIYASFPSYNNTNFIATIRSDCDVIEFNSIIKSFKPKAMQNSR